MTDELQTFIITIKRVFKGEPWDEVRPRAEEVWNSCGLSEDAPWSDVERHVREAWNQ